MATPAPGPSDFDAIRKSPSLTSGLIEALVAQIEKGDLAPGQRLPTEQAIVEATGVSRTVVREALASLRARGLITTRQGLGAFVSERPPPKAFSIVAEDMESVSQVLRLLELRIGVEAEAAALAAERRSGADLERMAGHLRDLDGAIRAQRSGGDEDFAFHREILASTRNPYFSRIFDVFGSLMIPRRRLRLEALPAEERAAYLKGVQREHRALLKAIKSRNIEAARHAAREHLMNSYQRYSNLAPSQKRTPIGAIRPDKE